MTPEKEKALKDEAATYSGTNYVKNHLPKIWNERYKAYIAGATAEALKNESNWISVADDLPKFNDMFTERVLAYDGDVMKVCSMFKGGGTDKITGYGTTGECFMRNVTHWQPLPAPPKK